MTGSARAAAPPSARAERLGARGDSVRDSGAALLRGLHRRHGTGSAMTRRRPLRQELCGGETRQPGPEGIGTRSSAVARSDSRTGLPGLGWLAGSSPPLGVTCVPSGSATCSLSSAWAGSAWAHAAVRALRERVHARCRSARAAREVALDAATVSVLRVHRTGQVIERLAWGAAYTDLVPRVGNDFTVGS